MTLETLFAGRNIDISAAQERMTALMSAEGLPYGDRTMTFNSRLAQELAAWAVPQMSDDAIHDALFRAYFVDGMNVALLDNLVAIAVRRGLPEEAARHTLEQREYRDVVDADWQRSRDLGITGVPTFVIGNHGLVGAQPYEALETLLLEADVERRAV